MALYHNIREKSCKGNHMVKTKKQKSQKGAGSLFYSSSPCSQDESTGADSVYKTIDTSTGRVLRGMPKFYPLVWEQISGSRTFRRH